MECVRSGYSQNKGQYERSEAASVLISPAPSWPDLGRTGSTGVCHSQLCFCLSLYSILTPTSGCTQTPFKHTTRNFFFNHPPSYRHHLEQHWHLYQQPKSNSCAITLRAPLAVTPASGQPYWSEGEGHRKICALRELAKFVINRFPRWREPANSPFMTVMSYLLPQWSFPWLFAFDLLHFGTSPLRENSSFTDMNGTTEEMRAALQKCIWWEFNSTHLFVEIFPLFQHPRCKSKMVGHLLPVDTFSLHSV